MYPILFYTMNTSETFSIHGVNFSMIYVAGGVYAMGATDGDDDATSEEHPARYKSILDFYIGETLVTQELWVSVMGYNPSHFKKGVNLPVECISWFDCLEFINRINQLTNKNFCLPEECQWEFAARGGKLSRKYKYAGSDNIDEIAWYNRNSNNHTHNVKELNPNELGLYDMCGNVDEWCINRPALYGNKLGNSPIYYRSEQYRIIRGGSWANLAHHCRVSSRGDETVDTRCPQIGMRLCMNITKDKS